jgi:hypothetical protein
VRGAGANQAESGSYGLNKTSANSELVIQLLVETEFLHARQKKNSATLRFPWQDDKLPVSVGKPFSSSSVSTQT